MFAFIYSYFGVCICKKALVSPMFCMYDTIIIYRLLFCFVLFLLINRYIENVVINIIKDLVGVFYCQLCQPIGI